jgi:hypothetical protein
VSRAERRQGAGGDEQAGQDGQIGRDRRTRQERRDGVVNPAGPAGPAGTGQTGAGQTGAGQTGRDVGADPDEHGRQSWLDADAGRLIRPYTVSNGRTKPSVSLDLLSMVRATGRALKVDLTPEHALALDLSRAPVTVAEIGAHLRLPVAVAKILLSDLIDQGAVSARPPDPAADPADRDILQRVLDGLHKRLLQ